MVGSSKYTAFLPAPIPFSLPSLPIPLPCPTWLQVAQPFQLCPLTSWSPWSEVLGVSSSFSWVFGFCPCPSLNEEEGRGRMWTDRAGRWQGCPPNYGACPHRPPPNPNSTGLPSLASGTRPPGPFPMISHPTRPAPGAPAGHRLHRSQPSAPASAMPGCLQFSPHLWAETVEGDGAYQLPAQS